MAELTSIIVVAYNSLSYLNLCLNSIISNTISPYELIVIDNASKDGTKKWLETNYKRFKLRPVRFILILNEDNKGYSEACNQGIARARGEYLAFLNSDILVSKDWLMRLNHHLKYDPWAGLVGPMGKGIGGDQNYEYIYKEYGYKKPLPRGLNSFSERLYHRYGRDYTETKFLIGCCLLTKRGLVDKIGLFDTSLFMSADDFDYSLRARMAGYKLYVAEDVLVHHFDHKSFQSLPQFQAEKYINEGWQAFREKWSFLLAKYSMNDLFYNGRKVFFSKLVKGRRQGQLD